MGCHTWTYKKFKKCNKKEQDEFLEKCQKDLNRVFRTYEEYSQSTKVCVEAYKKHYEEGSEEWNDWDEYGKEENIRKRYDEDCQKYSDFVGGLTADNILKYCEKFGESADYTIVSGELYIYYGFDTPFRLYGYPEDSFTDKEELLIYLRQQKESSVGYYDENQKEFITGYSKELEDRINEYFKENGEDNLYIEFG